MTKRLRRGKRKPAPAPPELPSICGFACPHADFPPADTAGICRTMAAVYCRKLRKLVNKNMPCQVKSKR